MMLKRLIAPALIASLTFVGAHASAQQAMPIQGPTADQQAQMQQMQQFMGQMMQNMQDKGIDPQEFFGSIRQQMQDGTLDQAALQQQMIDKGIIDKDMAAQMQQMQDNAQKANLDNLKTQLSASDDDWKLLQPRIQKVLNCMAVLGLNSRAGGMTGFMGTQSAASDLSKAMQSLRASLKDQATPAEIITSKLADWRAAHEKAKEDLTASQKDLQELLSLRQEGILANLGIL
jgi:hypothetical protein